MRPEATTTLSLPDTDREFAAIGDEPVRFAGAGDASLPAPQRGRPVLGWLVPARPDSAGEGDYTVPSPPSESEKYAYLGGQKRWALFASALSFGILVLSIVKFALLQPALYPFLALATITICASLLSTGTSTRKRRISRASHVRLVSEWAGTAGPRPSVDVLLPSAGEDLAVLENTFHHVAALEWDGSLDVHVLDDSDRPEVRRLAARYDFTYRTRPNRGHLKKAGNLLYGFQHSSGDLIVVFDADFVPRADFLSELVPYFDDPTVGIVQSPQYFDTDGRMNWLQRAAGATQELFYRWVQPSRDAADAPICVGTNAIYRRAALEEVGGFAQIGHSEDVHTGVKLMKAGFRTRYVPVLVAKGLCPDRLDGFLNQQYRWCSGSMSLLADRTFHAAALSWRQKLCFFSGFSYYLTTALFVFTAPLPMLLMLWALPRHITHTNYLPLLPALVMAYVVMPRLFHADWRPEVLRVQLAYSYAHALAVWDAVRGRTASWVPTGAAGKGTPLATKIKRLMRVWVLTIQGTGWSGVLLDVQVRDVPISTLAPLAGMLAVAAIIQLPLLMPVRTPREKAELRRRRTAALVARLPLVGNGREDLAVPA